MTATPTKLTVDVWSDVACPWCRIGRANLTRALAQLDDPDDVQVTWHSFELDPSAPATTDQTLAAQLAAKFGTDEAGVARMWQTVAARGADAGLTFDFGSVRPGNTFDAHRLIHLARERGVQDALVGALFDAHHERGVALGDRAELAAVAVGVGLDPDEVGAVLAGDAFAADVRADEELAARLGISGVPFFVVDGRYGLSGAQPPEAILEVLAQARTERA